MYGLVRPRSPSWWARRGKRLGHGHGAPGTVGNLSHSFGGVSVDPDEAN